MSYHDNGQTAVKGNYIDNKKHGPWEFFDPDGNKLKVIDYSRGKKTGEEIYKEK